MLQIIKRYFWIVLLATGWQAARGFSLLGPLPPDAGGEPWQIFAIGYAEGGVSYFGSIPGGPVWLQDIGGPHNLGEEYRRNTRVLYYTYDASFVEDYFGLEAITNIDGAFAILNSLNNVDSYSGNLSEFPLSSQEYNFTAQALYLTDIKSMTLHLLVEQLGLADSARYTWTLHDRFDVPGLPCPIGEVYMVIQRNFDVVPSSLQQVQYSPYVNGALLSYYISEVCSGSSLLAATVPYLTDPAGQLFGPVSANTFLGDWNSDEFNTAETLHLPTIYGLQIGGYYTGLTRDDVAGLRYLFSTNNINLEPIPAASLLFSVVTNFNVQALLPSPTNTPTGNPFGFYVFDGTYGYGDYGALIAASMTNSPAVIQAAYPGIVIASSSNYFVLATNYTFRQYFTNAGVGTTFPPPLTLVTVSNAHPFLLQKYVTTFANVVPNKVKSTTTVKQQTVVVQPQPGAPFPSPLVTNTTTKTIVQNIPSGDFFVLPLFHTNVCPIDFLYTGLTNVTTTTNFLTSTATNVVTATNSSSFSATLIQITYFTNYIFVIHPVNCAELAGAPKLYQGIGRIQFKRVDFDSLFGQTYDAPLTNYYTMVSMTNSQLQVQKLVRVVNTPDILIAAADIAAGPQAIPFLPTVVRSTPNWNSTQIIRGLRGPGMIDSPTTITFNKVGPTFFNGPFVDAASFINPTEVNETTQMQGLQWGSYDGTTNDPIVYPNGTSIQELENQLLIRLTSTPAGPLMGGVGVPLNIQFHASGGAFSPPFTWSATGYPVGIGILYGLPPGLVVTSDGFLTGTPAAAGTYDFVLIATDQNGKTVQWNLSIIIN